jgi:hypothetical protein
MRRQIAAEQFSQLRFGLGYEVRGQKEAFSELRRSFGWMLFPSMRSKPFPHPPLLTLLFLWLK